jgi:hypothetical protein
VLCEGWVETGLFFAALIVGVYYFSRQRDE